jgi:phenylalanyl-tRNA synthetase alpha chain
MSNLSKLKTDLLKSISAANDLGSLEEFRINELAKKGQLAEEMKKLGTLPVEEKKTVGAALNEVKAEVMNAFTARKAQLEEAALSAKLSSEKIDMTLPSRPEFSGKIHPITQVMEEAIAIFAAQGFMVADGPDIDSDFNNFTAL